MRTGFVALSRDPGEDRLSPRAWLVLMLVAVAALLPGLFSIPVVDRDEARYAQASRQMLETGEFVDIRFQDEARHKQPVMTYWLQAAAAVPFGGADAPIGAHRLPGFLLSLAAVALTAFIGARLFSPYVGFAAGIALAATLLLALEARTAKTDAILLGFGMIAQAGLAMILLKGEGGRPGFWGWPAAMWAAIGASLLVKGPIFFMITALTLAVYAGWKRDPGLFLKVRPLPGIALALAIFLPWFLAINLQTDWAFAQKAVGWSLLGKVTEAHEAHGGPLGYHLMLSPLVLWPASALLGLALLAAWRGREDDRVKFLIAWALPTYVVFELVATKLPHYTLPALPAIAILVALGLDRWRELLAGWRSKAFYGTLAAFGVLAGLVVAGVPLAARLFFELEPGLAAYATLAMGIVAAVAVIALVLRPGLDRLIAVAVAAAATYAAAFAFAIPAVTPMWISRDMGRFAAQLAGCEDIAIAVAGYREPSIAFNVGTATLRAEDGTEAGAFLLAHPECGMAFVDVAQAEAFQAVVEAAGGELRALGTLTGYNYVKGDDLVMTAFTLERSAVRVRD